MNVYITSDSHYGHKNICGPDVSDWAAGYRDFKCLKDMNDAIVDSYNSTVQPDDTLYHLGDWSFGGVQNIEEFRKRIRCKNIILIYGNHDHHIRKSHKHLFSRCYDFLETYINNQFVVLSHYAMRVWQKSHHGAWHLYGHSHGSLPDTGGKCFDIGWCVWRKPLSFFEVKEIMDARSVDFVDHHNKGTAQ